MISARKRRGRVVVAALLLAAAATPASATDGLARRAGLVSSRGGAFWYAATIAVPAGGTFGIDLTWTTGLRTSATAGLVVTRRAGRPDSFVALTGAALRPGDRRYATIAPGGPAPPIRIGSSSASPDGLDGEFRMQTQSGAADAGDVLDIVVIVAADAPVRSQRVALRQGAGSRIRAESSGRGSILRRDPAFDAPIRAGASATRMHESVFAGAAAGIVAGAQTTATFRRSAVAILNGYWFPHVVGAGSWQGGVPVVLTMAGPDGRVTAPDRIVRAGPPGEYRFRIEAMAAPFVYAFADRGGAAAGRGPVVFLAAADADFPACTARGIRVLARAHDRHPICGP